MAISRYKNLNPFINATEGYKKTFRKRYGEIGIRQMPTNFLNYPTQEQFDSINTISVNWTTGDRLYKLATTYYNNPEYWWIIAWFNKKPTEQLIQLGETILVPLYLDEVLTAFGL